MNKIIVLLLVIGSFILGISISHTIGTSIIIKSRCRDLGLMQYNSKKDGFVFKSDSLYISSWDLYYIMYGTMKGYKTYEK